MKYRLYKPRYDSRLMTAGVVFPDGFYRIFEMTRWNGRGVDALLNRGYAIEEDDSELPCGIYDELTNERVTDASVIAAIDNGGRQALQFIRKDDPYDDPMTTLGMPKSAFKRGYQPPIKGNAPPASLTKEDMRAESRARSMKRGAA